MRWLLVTTPITTVATLWVLHDLLWFSGWLLLVATSLGQVALGAVLARRAGRDWRSGATWAAIALALTGALVVGLFMLFGHGFGE